MYAQGEKVIYGGEGVCVIDKIDKLSISGMKNDKLYYYLTPYYRGGTIYAPIDTPVHMRYLISKDEALELIDRIPEIPAEVFKTANIRLLSEHYQSIIKSYKCEDLVRVIKAIHLKREIALENGKRLGSVDERFMNKAEDMLWGELAIALGIEKSEVDAFITARVEKPE